MEGEAIKLLLELDEEGIAISSGSACSATTPASPRTCCRRSVSIRFEARGSLRITLGRFNTMEEAERFLEVLPAGRATSLRPIAAAVRLMQSQLNTITTTL